MKNKFGYFRILEILKLESKFCLLQRIISLTLHFLTTHKKNGIGKVKDFPPIVSFMSFLHPFVNMNKYKFTVLKDHRLILISLRTLFTVI